jgi:sialate O-acetylesterase
MGPDALIACGEKTTGNSTSTSPTNPSCLYYSMIYPLLPLPINGLLWYQGESNAGNPVNYSHCFPAMINEWRQAWSNQTSNQTDPAIPFFFAQLSSWPSGDSGAVANTRYAQMAALKLPKVAMSVAADIGDAASPAHPVHPIYKEELGRRTWLAGWNIIYGNTSSPVQGPQLLKAQVDHWDSTWGDYHYGMGSSNACNTASTGFTCLGIRLTFDQSLLVLSNSQPYVNGFEIITSTNTIQPVSYTGLRDSDTTIQLNVTLVGGNLTTLRYAWHDYPIMPFYSQKFNLPIQPFNLTSFS